MPKHSKGYWFDKQENRWRIRFAVPGSRGRSYKESLGPEWKEKQIIERVANLKKQAVEGALGRQDRPISDALEVYLETAEYHKGYDKLKSHIKAIWPWIDGKMLSELSNVARDYRRFHKSKLAGATINRRVAILRRLGRIAMERDWLQKKVHFEWAPEKHRTTHLTMEQVEALVAATDNQSTKDAIWLAVCTGWRRGEIGKLTQANVVGDRLWIADSKNGEPRISPIHNRIKDVVTRLPIPVRMETVYQCFKRAAKKIGMPDLRFHDLRHTTASLIINAGGTLKDVQEVLGHRSVITANRYSHMLIERKKHILDLALQPQTAPTAKSKIA
jgi:integrase